MSVTGTNPRQEAVDQLDRTWENALRSNGSDVAIPINLAVAAISALLYIGDQVKRIADQLAGQP